jgi:DNA-binding MarR family transcriptional regulator
MYFENASGDPELDWLRNGLTDMLVTDLSQSEGVDVLSTTRLFQILRTLKQQDEQVISLEVVQEVAKRAQVDRVILGSFMKAGENIRMELTGLPSGTIYPILRRFERNGLVRSRWENPQEARNEGRPRRRYYELTPAGREILSVAAERFRQHERIFGHTQATNKTP